ncbi:ABC transporter ATP-binding protein [Intrasporangium mesophilum]
METTFVVRARGVTKTFGDVVALDGVDLDVAAGEVHGLVGPNGAGKTTLLGLLLGLAVASHGSLEILGSPVGRVLAVPDAVAGFVDGPGLYPALSPRKNLSALMSLRGRVPSRREVDDALEQVGLTGVADDPLRGFSLGMRQRLGLAAALLTRPGLLVLDEPANGLDPAGKKQVHRILTDLAAQGTAVVMSSHRMDDLAALCSEVTLLATGRVVFSGPLSKLAAESRDLDYRVVTSAPAAALEIASGTPGLRVLRDDELALRRQETDLVVRGGVAAMDELVVRLVGARVALRELAPVVSPLESAFLALTGAVAEGDAGADPIDPDPADPDPADPDPADPDPADPDHVATTDTEESR